MRKKNYTFWLILTYIVMAALCAALIIFFKQSISSIIINVAMFVVVGIIYTFAVHKFTDAWKFQKALFNATKKIKEDSKSDTRYLWETYKNNEKALFDGSILGGQYQKFAAEMTRLEQLGNTDYKVDVEDYINKDYIDAAVNKNVLNLVPGTMTGLGILGTFVGLSFGLQYFNTGTAAEITESIAPLMEGIKIAFHTSVYGMVFSLVFNFVYKGTMEAVYVQLEEFLSAFNTYVSGNPANDNENSLREMLQTLPDTLGAAISAQMGENLAPIVYNMNKTMMDFAQTISDNQAQGLKGLVNEFVEKLNVAMGDSYREFGRIISETCEIQRNNNIYAQNIMDKLGSLSNNIADINSMSLSIVNNMAGYVTQIDNLQKIMSDNYNSAYRQLDAMRDHEETMQKYIYTIASGEKEISENIQKELDTVMDMSRVFADDIGKTSKELTQVLSTAKVQLDQSANALSSASIGLDDKLSKSLKTTFEMFDTNMAQITTHLSTTIDQIAQTTDRVPEVVVAAYDGMKRSFDKMQEDINGVLRSMNNFSK